eukprot:scaffold28963_cov63-Phaeocystis_antarctica.AAC.3
MVSSIPVLGRPCGRALSHCQLGGIGPAGGGPQHHSSGCGAQQAARCPAGELRRVCAEQRLERLSSEDHEHACCAPRHRGDKANTAKSTRGVVQRAKGSYNHTGRE